MAESKNTPKTWYVSGTRPAIADPHYVMTDSSSEWESVAIVEGEEYANLIAAAPEMLAALEDLVQQTDDLILTWSADQDGTDDERRVKGAADRARAAIAKAKGE